MNIDGKNSLATNIRTILQSFKELEKAKKHYFSLEMSSEQLTARIVSEIAGLSSENIRTGNLSKIDFNKLIKASESLKNISLFIDDSPH